MRIGYNRAARIIEEEASGIVSSMNSAGNRDVLAPEPIDKAMLYKVWSLAVILAAITAGILLLESQLQQVVLLPDQGAGWYFWKRTSEFCFFRHYVEAT